MKICGKRIRHSRRTASIRRRIRQLVPISAGVLPGALVAPSFKEINFSLYKNTPISERASLQLRAEFFNLFNHPNFANPSMPNFIADIGSPDAATGVHSGYYQITAPGDV